MLVFGPLYVRPSCISCCSHFSNISGFGLNLVYCTKPLFSVINVARGIACKFPLYIHVRTFRRLRLHGLLVFVNFCLASPCVPSRICKVIYFFTQRIYIIKPGGPVKPHTSSSLSPSDTLTITNFIQGLFLGKFANSLRSSCFFQSEKTALLIKKLAVGCLN